MLGWMCDAGVLPLLDLRHVGLVEAGLESALAAPDSSEDIRRNVSLYDDRLVGTACCVAEVPQGAQHRSTAAAPSPPPPRTMQVLSLASEALRLGVQQPTSDWLPTGLRLHAKLLQRSWGKHDAGCAAHNMLAKALAHGALEGSSDMLLAARTLLAQLLPLYQQGGHRDAEYSLLGRLACCAEELAPLRQLPELSAAVEQWLAGRYDGRSTGEATGGEEDACSEDVASWDSQEAEGSLSTDSHTLFYADYDLLQWWLSDASTALQRAQASLGAVHVACEPDASSGAGGRSLSRLRPSCASCSLCWQEA